MSSDDLSKSAVSIAAHLTSELAKHHMQKSAAANAAAELAEARRASSVGASSASLGAALQDSNPNRYITYGSIAASVARNEAAHSTTGPREISSIAFPYVDLEEAIGVARAMLGRGGVPMERDQVAAAIGQVPGGAFNNKLGAARQFGLIENVQSKWQITPLGFEILDPLREASARSQAFLNVELYRKTYDEYKGRLLPPRPHGLESAFVSFGVSSKQKDKARQTFERSARQAGFFSNAAEDRLVAPVVQYLPDLPPAEGPVAREADSPAQARPAQAASAPALSPFVQGLLDELPPPRSEWSMADRAKWLQAAAHIFDLIYAGGSGRITVLQDG